MGKEARINAARKAAGLPIYDGVNRIPSESKLESLLPRRTPGKSVLNGLIGLALLQEMIKVREMINRSYEK